MPPGSELLALQEAVAGRYAVERELGRGGMGVVFLARDLALDRLVAIKLLPPALAASADRRARFLREARTAARLSHPNIVPIHSVEESDGLVFFVMGYVAGETLGERVRRHGRLPAAEVTQVVREVAWALAYAHRQGVVHRDVKPENILLEREGGRAMVTDFGIAQVSGDAADTPAGQVIGTARAVSPEQAAGEPVDGRSDLYSLGVAAYLAATGQWPFDGDSAAAVLAKHLTQTPPSVLGLRPDLPAPLAHAIERCLAKSPADRFASGEELAAALGSTLPVLATTPAPVARAARELHELGTDLGGYGSVMLFVVVFNLVTRFYHPFGRGRCLPGAGELGDRARDGGPDRRTEGDCVPRHQGRDSARVRFRGHPGRAPRVRRGAGACQPGGETGCGRRMAGRVCRIVRGLVLGVDGRKPLAEPGADRGRPGGQLHSAQRRALGRGEADRAH